MENQKKQRIPCNLDYKFVQILKSNMLDIETSSQTIQDFEFLKICWNVVFKKSCGSQHHCSQNFEILQIAKKICNFNDILQHLHRLVKLDEIAWYSAKHGAKGSKYLERYCDNLVDHENLSKIDIRS